MELTVNTSKRYTIRIERGCIGSTRRLLRLALFAPGKKAVVSHGHPCCAALSVERVSTSLRNAGFDVTSLRVSGGRTIEAPFHHRRHLWPYGRGPYHPQRLCRCAGRRRHRGYGGLCRGQLFAWHPLCAGANHPALPRWIPPWAAKPASTCRRGKTWWAPSGSPPLC